MYVARLILGSCDFIERIVSSSVYSNDTIPFDLMERRSGGGSILMHASRIGSPLVVGFIKLFPKMVASKPHKCLHAFFFIIQV